jgi:hypothetical protein
MTWLADILYADGRTERVTVDIFPYIGLEPQDDGGMTIVGINNLEGVREVRLTKELKTRPLRTIGKQGGE